MFQSNSDATQWELIWNEHVKIIAIGFIVKYVKCVLYENYSLLLFGDAFYEHLFICLCGCFCVHFWPNNYNIFICLFFFPPFRWSSSYFGFISRIHYNAFLSWRKKIVYWLFESPPWERKLNISNKIISLYRFHITCFAIDYSQL